MIDLNKHEELIVRQEVEHLEVFSDFETKNRYSIATPTGEDILYAYEESSGVARYFLKRRRPLQLHVVDDAGGDVLTASRDFFWLLSSVKVSDESGRYIGSLNRRFAVARRRFSLLDANNRLVAEIHGSIFRRYTFMIQNPAGDEIGRVTKQWSGLGREMFTDADTFQILFGGAEQNRELRLLILAAAFAIDLDFFEN